MARRVLRALLRLLPADVRGDLGRGIEETFADERRDARTRRRRTMLWITNAIAFARLGLPLHAEQTWQDLRYAVRALRATPVFTTVALVALAFGVGSTTATFSMADAFLLKPLPFAEPDRLVHIWASDQARGVPEARASLQEYRAWRRLDTIFEDVAVFNYTSEDLTSSAEPERIPSGRVSAGVFDLLGTRAAIGRTFVEGDDQPGAAPVVVISDRFWRQRLGGRTDVLEQRIELSGTRHQVVGVMPASFVFPLPITEIWVPRLLDPERLPATTQPFQIVARLREHVSPAVAEAAASVASQSAATAFPVLAGRSARVVPLRQALNFAHDIFAIGSLVVGMANLLVLLAACANISSLMLGRAIRRAREAALRAALGASRFRLVRQYLIESLMLGIAGGALGAVLAVWGAAIANRVVPADLYKVSAFAVDARALAVAVALSLVAALMFGLLPALRLAGGSLVGAMRQESGGTTSRQSLRLQSSLVTTQMAVSVVLLAGTLLVSRSYLALSRVEPGFTADEVLSVQTILPRARYESAESRRQFQVQALERVRTVPGVRHAAFVNFLPLNHEASPRAFTPPGANADASRLPLAWELTVSEDYFSVLQIPLLEGRTFASHDRTGAAPVVVINLSMARKHWPGRSPIGTTLALDGSGPHEVIGVVADSRQFDLAEAGREQIFLAQQQRPLAYVRLLVRGDTPPGALTPGVVAALRAVDPRLPLTEIQPLREVVDAFLLPQRSLRVLLLVLGACALGLALFGIYGILACFVAERTRELGIRLAVGANRQQIVRYVVARGVRLAARGTLIGLPVAVGAGYLMRGLVFGVSATDPVSYAAVGVLVMTIAVAASYLPARRAAGISPLVAIRSE